MRRISWVIILPLSLLCVAHADSVSFNLSHFTYSFGPNQGGDNAGYIMIGPGIGLTGGGSASCEAVPFFCLTEVVLQPGSTVSASSITIDFESSQGFVLIDGQKSVDEEVTLFISAINGSDFTLPEGGRTPSVFTVSVPAAFATVTGDASGTLFNVNIPPGELVLKFDYFPGEGYIFSQANYVSSASPVPESDTLGLVATGLLGVAGLMWAKMRPRIKKQAWRLKPLF